MRLQLVSGCKLTKNDQKLTLESKQKHLSWQDSSATLYHCLQQLLEGEEEDKLLEIFDVDLAQFYYLLEHLQKHLLLTYSSGALAAIFPQGSFSLQMIDLREKKLQLSRFFFSRLEDEQIVFETPLAPAKLVIQDKQIYGLLSALAKPHSLQMLVKAYPEIDERHLEDLLILLYSAKMIEEKEDPALKTWEFHDLVLHTRTRIGRHANPFGGTFPFKGQIEHEPVCKRPFDAPHISLYAPPLDQLLKEDPPFATVVEARKSIREESCKSLNEKQLGEFLFRSARIKTLGESQDYKFSKRPYPGGGAMYELEVYPLVFSCEGLDKGLYHYDPLEHALRKTEASWRICQELLEDAKRSTAKKTFPQVLFIIGARFQRVSWKYRSISYSIILKNTGVLLQTMYLTATAMNLGGCAVGGGNADLFSEAIGSNYYQESSVGEFILS